MNQLWVISYPSGEARRISSDLNDYSGTSLTADSKTLATVQNDWTANIWTAPITDPASAKQITTGKLEGTKGLAFAPDGRIVYTVNTQGTNDIWIMNADGTNQRPLATDPSEDQLPNVTPDGRYIVFTSERGGFPSLWRMDLDGANLKQLTFSQEDYAQNVSPDGRWVLFHSWRSGRMSPADRIALVEFQQKAARLQRAVQGANGAANALTPRLAAIRRALIETPNAPESLMSDAAAIEKRKNEILKAMSGDQALRQRNFKLPPSINERVGLVVGASRMSTARPTQTQIDQYAHGAAEFEGVLSQLRQLIEVDLQALEKKMEAAGAPWTPGRIPEWKDQ